MTENRITFNNQKRVRRLIIFIAVAAVILIIVLLLFAGRVFDWNHSQVDNHLLDVVGLGHPVDPDWSPEFTMLDNGELVCSVCVDDLLMMLEQCRYAGGRPFVYSAYRSESAHQRVIDSAADVFVKQGMEEEAARQEAEALLGIPGTSDHQLGYAVDILNGDYEANGLDRFTVDWLQDNCWKFGFIAGGATETIEYHGLTLQPCHYRYVGYEPASQIHELGITLEEYVDMFYKN